MVWYETALVSACATLLAALAAAFFAISQIRNQRRMARTRAMLDLMVKYESDTFYQNTVKAYRAFRDRTFEPEHLVDPKDEAQREQAALLNAFLNFQEIVALGIRHDALDRALFSDWWATSYVAVWNTSLPLTRLLRARAPNVLVEFEALAKSIARQKKLAFEPAALPTMTQAR